MVRLVLWLQPCGARNFARFSSIMEPKWTHKTRQDARLFISQSLIVNVIVTRSEKTLCSSWLIVVQIRQLRTKEGEDTFQTASFDRRDSILKKLILKFEPPLSRIIALYELHGASNAHCRPASIENVLPSCKKAIEMRRMNSCFDVETLQPNPVYTFAQEVHTVEELETRCQNLDFVYVYALMIYERILGPNHPSMQSASVVPRPNVQRGRRI